MIKTLINGDKDYVIRYKSASSPLLRRKPVMPMMQGADIVRPTLPSKGDVMRESLRRDHSSIREHSDTDCALSPSRYRLYLMV